MPSRGKRLCVIGGGGYLGSVLSKELLDFGHQVVLFDQSFPDCIASDEAITVKGDVGNVGDLKKALKQCDGAFHLASYGMSGKEMLNREKIHEVNICGTQNVIKACISCGVPRLVYASTVNVVFGGQEIINGTEDLPYFPAKKQVDYYSETKAIAERHVLLANNRSLHRRTPDDSRLRTCALRFVGIYGPNERRHQPRIAKMMKEGCFQFTYGQGKASLTQYVNGGNCAQALRRAYDGLNAGSEYMAAGKAYFIADGEPVDSFEFWRPLADALGVPFPRFRLPLWFMYYLAYFLEVVFWMLSPLQRCLKYQPILTRAEVYKMGVTHYFSIDRAKKELGYRPRNVNDLTEAAKLYQTQANGARFAATMLHQKQKAKPKKLHLLIALLTAACFVLLGAYLLC